MDDEKSTIKLSLRDKEIDRRCIEKTRKGFLGFFILRWRLTIILMLGLAIWGALSLLALPREANPEVQIPIAMVSTVYPGASPGAVEELVTNKIEDKLDGLENMDNLTSNSSFGVSTVVAEFEAGADLTESIRALRDRVAMISGLPDEALDPQVTEIRVNDMAIVTFSLVGDLTDGQLKYLGKRVQAELEAITGVSRVDLLGARAREYQVTLNEAKMQRLGIGANEAVAAINSSNINFPLGTVEVDRIRYNVRVVGEIRDAEELKDLVVRNTGLGLILLGDIAEVRDELRKKSTISRVSLEKGPLKNVVSLQVYKKTGGNIIKIIDQAKDKLDELKEREVIPKEARVEVVSDISKFIRDDLNTLGRSGIQTFILIFILLALALAIRQAAVAALSVPLIFLGAFGVLKLQGQTINSLTLFSLVLSLGLLVDTLIIILEGLHDNLMKGYSPQESALLSVGTFKWPLTAGVLTTISAFVPMFLVSGVTGEFLETMPLTISATLAISLLVALIIIPSLAAVVVSSRKQKSALGQKAKKQFSNLSSYAEAKDLADKEHLMEKYFTQPVQRWYRVFIRRLLLSQKKRRGLVFLVILGFFGAMAVLFLNVVPVLMFGDYDIDYFVVNVELPNGSVLEETEKRVRLVEEGLLKTPEVKSFVTNIGSGGGLAFTGFGASGGTSEHLAAVTVNLYELKKKSLFDFFRSPRVFAPLRERKSYEVASDLRKEFKKIDGAKVMISEVRGGPPSGAAVEVRVTGDNLVTLEKIAEDIKEKLEQIKGATEVDAGIRVAPPEFGFKLKHQELGRYNLNASQVASGIRTAVFGTEAITVTREGEDIDVVVRYPETSVDSVEELKNLRIVTSQGAGIALSQVADFELTSALENISHRNLKRIVSITAKNEGKTPAVIFSELQREMDTYDLPEGYEIIYGGEFEQMTEVFRELYYAMSVAVLLILLILILEFDSFRQPIIIILTLPMALIGVVLGLLVLRLEFGFAAFLGIVGLAGIVVNDAIVLIDRINHNLKERELELVEAIAEAGEARLQPIFLTTVTTIAGVLPLYFADEFWRGLSVTVAFGLAFSTILTLTLIPVLYRWLEQKKAAVGVG